MTDYVSLKYRGSIHSRGLKVTGYCFSPELITDMSSPQLFEQLKLKLGRYVRALRM